MNQELNISFHMGKSIGILRNENTNILKFRKLILFVFKKGKSAAVEGFPGEKKRQTRILICERWKKK